MANVKSYAWSKRLDTEVEDTTTTDVMTPGFTDPASYRTDETEMVLDGNVLTAEQASSAWASDFSKVTVTNSSGDGWAPGQTLYVTVAGTPFNPADVQASFDALEARVTNLESSLNALNTQISGLQNTVNDQGTRLSAAESAITDLQSRVTVLEAAPGPPAMMSEADKLHAKHGGSAPSDEAQKAADAEKHHGKKHDDDNDEKHDKHSKKGK